MSPISIKMWTKPILSLDLTGGGVPESSPQPDPDTNDYLTFGNAVSDRLYFGTDDYLYFETVS